MFLSQGALKYLGNTGWLVAERVLRRGISRLVIIYLARYLGPERFGLLSYATAIFGIFAVVATLGTNRILIREAVNQPEQHDAILGTSLVLRLVAGCILIVAIYLVTYTFNAGDPITPVLAVIIGTGLLFQSLHIIELWFQAEVKVKYAVIAKAVAALVIAGAKFTLILLGAPLLAFAFAIAGEYALVALTLVIAYHMTGHRVRHWKFRPGLGLEFLSQGWPEILAGLGTILCMRMDQVMIGQMLGAEGVGIYTAASQISEALYFVPVAVVTSTFPAIVAARARDRNLYYRRLQQLLSGVTIYSYAVAVAVTLLSGWLIALLYGTRFSGAEDILVIHVWTGVAVGLGITSGSWIMAEKRTRLSLYRMSCGAILNIILNYFLIRAMGINGAAIATLVSLSCAYYLFDVVRHETREMFAMKTRALFCRGLEAWPVHAS